MYKILHLSYTVFETVEDAPLWKRKINNYTGRMTSIRNLVIFPLGRNVAMISLRNL